MFYLLHLLVTAAAGVAIVASLRLLQRIDLFVKPMAAPHIQFRFPKGAPFPCHLLPDGIRDNVATGSTLLLYVSATCSLCTDLLRPLHSFVRQYPEYQFVLLTAEPWPELRVIAHRRVRVIENLQLVKELGITMLPYAMSIKAGDIADFGVVNTAEHLESLL